VWSALPGHWATLLWLVWLGGVAWVLLGVIRGWIEVRRTAAAARPVADSAWLALLAETTSRLGVRHDVRLLRHPEGTTPLTWGVRHPVVLLPADADEWPAEHRRAVLLHELAHVRRWDWLVQLLAYAACAMFWFHPGAWWALHRLRLAREFACDDRALDAGLRASDYAECLLHIARRMRARGVIASVAVSVGMTRRSPLRERLLAVLDRHRVRRPPSRRRAGVLIAGGAAVFVALGAAHFVARTDTLVRALRHERWEVRANAASLLAAYPSPATAAALAEAGRSDPSAIVREHARASLERLLP
jgi:beta-lactamase regulating signal transducer with metallopeptidase domain